MPVLFSSQFINHALDFYSIRTILWRVSPFRLYGRIDRLIQRSANADVFRFPGIRLMRAICIVDNFGTRWNFPSPSLSLSLSLPLSLNAKARISFNEIPELHRRVCQRGLCGFRENFADYAPRDYSIGVKLGTEYPRVASGILPPPARATPAHLHVRQSNYFFIVHALYGMYL